MTVLAQPVRSMMSVACPMNQKIEEEEEEKQQ